MNRTPEFHLIRKEERQARLATIEADEYDTARLEFIAAYNRFGLAHGYGEAKAVCAMLASANLEPQGNRHVQAAERLFKGRAA